MNLWRAASTIIAQDIGLMRGSPFLNIVRGESRLVECPGRLVLFVVTSLTENA
jgi:hypothetical protein